MAGTRYIIKTKDGERGPFDSAQIRELAAQGKLLGTMKVRDAVHNYNVTVAEIIDGRAKIHAMAVSTSDLDIEDVPGAPSLTPAKTGSGSHQSARKSSDSRRNQHRTSSSRRPINDGPGDRSGRHTRNKSSSGMLWVAIAIALIGAVVLVVVGLKGSKKPTAPTPTPTVVPFSAPSAH